MEQGSPLCVRLGEGGFIIKEGLLQILFPPRCVVCDEILEAELIRGGRWIHPDCGRKLYPVGDYVCFRCGKPLAAVEQEYCFDCKKKLTGRNALYCRQGRSVYVYKGEIRKSVYRLKYSNRREYARFFAEETAKYYSDWCKRAGVEAIVPVPMYGRKKRRRGYNQAEIIARELARILGLPMENAAVKRVRNTKPQKLLSDEERKNNLKKAFQARKFIVKYKKILLVDDIYTTGSTVEAVAHELMRCGVEQVFFLTLCTGEGIVM